eukprot:6201538-Pyramimonas_sp.AAC.1
MRIDRMLPRSGPTDTSRERQHELCQPAVPRPSSQSYKQPPRVISIAPGPLPRCYLAAAARCR